MVFGVGVVPTRTYLDRKQEVSSAEERLATLSKGATVVFRGRPQRWIRAPLLLPTRLIQEANPEWRLVSWALALEAIAAL